MFDVLPKGNGRAPRTALVVVQAEGAGAESLTETFQVSVVGFQTAATYLSAISAGGGGSGSGSSIGWVGVPGGKPGRPWSG
jgi:hypothetical protein